MDDRRKLAQRLMVGVDAADPDGAVQIVRDSQVGGIFIGGNDTALLRDGNLEDVQKAADVPLAVGVDDEGGRVQRIDDLVGDLPSAREMAKKSPQQVTDLARDRARKLRDIGITWNLAPDVDVSDQPAKDVIGDRSFSDDPNVVTDVRAGLGRGPGAGRRLRRAQALPRPRALQRRLAQGRGERPAAERSSRRATCCPTATSSRPGSRWPAGRA